MKSPRVLFCSSLETGPIPVFFSEDACAAAAEPKEMYVADDAEHIDLYDRLGRIPFDKLTDFFQNYLK